MVRPQIYSPTVNLVSNNVNWRFELGASVTYNGVLPLFTSTTGNFNVWGKGSFIANQQVIGMTSPNNNYFEAYSISSLTSNPITVSNGNLVVDVAENITGLGGIQVSGGSVSITANTISSISQPIIVSGGSLYVEAELVKGSIDAILMTGGSITGNISNIIGTLGGNGIRADGGIINLKSALISGGDGNGGSAGNALYINNSPIVNIDSTQYTSGLGSPGYDSVLFYINAFSTNITINGQVMTGGQGGSGGSLTPVNGGNSTFAYITGSTCNITINGQLLEGGNGGEGSNSTATLPAFLGGNSNFIYAIGFNNNITVNGQIITGGDGGSGGLGDTGNTGGTGGNSNLVLVTNTNLVTLNGEIITAGNGGNGSIGELSGYGGNNSLINITGTAATVVVNGDILLGGKAGDGGNAPGSNSATGGPGGNNNFIYVIGSGSKAYVTGNLVVSGDGGSGGVGYISSNGGDATFIYGATSTQVFTNADTVIGGTPGISPAGGSRSGKGGSGSLINNQGADVYIRGSLAVVSNIATGLGGNGTTYTIIGSTGTIHYDINNTDCVSFCYANDIQLFINVDSIIINTPQSIPFQLYQIQNNNFVPLKGHINYLSITGQFSYGLSLQSANLAIGDFTSGSTVVNSSAFYLGSNYTFTNILTPINVTINNFIINRPQQGGIFASDPGTLFTFNTNQVINNQSYNYFLDIVNIAAPNTLPLSVQTLPSTFTFNNANLLGKLCNVTGSNLNIRGKVFNSSYSAYEAQDFTYTGIVSFYGSTAIVGNYPTNLNLNIDKINFESPLIGGTTILPNSSQPTYLFSSYSNSQPLTNALDGATAYFIPNMINVKINSIDVLPYNPSTTTASYRNDIGILYVDDHYTVHSYDIDYIYIPPVGSTVFVYLTPLYYIADLPVYTDVSRIYNYGLMIRTKRTAGPVGSNPGIARESMIFIDEVINSNNNLPASMLLEGEFVNNQTYPAPNSSTIVYFNMGTTQSQPLNVKNITLVNNDTTGYCYYNNSNTFGQTINIYSYSASNVNEFGSIAYTYNVIFGNAHGLSYVH